MQTQYQDTIDLANGRIKENNGVVTVTKASITKYEDNRETRQTDLEEAEDDLDRETTRWANETAINDKLMAEL